VCVWVWCVGHHYWQVVAEDVHAKYGGTTMGIAVRGSKDENKLKAKGLTKKSKEQWWEEEGKAAGAGVGKPGSAAGKAGVWSACCVWDVCVFVCA
jgi:hypothetical protein